MTHQNYPLEGKISKIYDHHWLLSENIFKFLLNSFPPEKVTFGVCATQFQGITLYICIAEILESQKTLKPQIFFCSPQFKDSIKYEANGKKENPFPSHPPKINKNLSKKGTTTTTQTPKKMAELYKKQEKLSTMSVFFLRIIYGGLE